MVTIDEVESRIEVQEAQRSPEAESRGATATAARADELRPVVRRLVREELLRYLRTEARR